MTTYNFVNEDDDTVLTVETDEGGIITKSNGDYDYIVKDAERRYSDGVPFKYVAGKLGRRFGVDEVGGERKTKTVEKHEAQIAEVGDIAKLDEDKQMVFGWAYVSHDKDGKVQVDKSGEFIDDWTELEDAAYKFVIKSRAAGDSHRRHADRDEAVTVGTMIESMMFTPEKVEKMGLPKGVLPTGWWVGFKIEDADVWKAVKSGQRPAFSIHGKGMREAVDG